jgi:hypothetical protein
MHRHLRSLLLVAALVSPAMISGCSAHVRVYDAEYHDYHVWDHREVVYYQQWETETHREHRDFDRRSDADKREYWKWRHSHEDHDHH